MLQRFPFILFKNNKTQKVVNFIGEAEDAETHEIVCVYEDFLKSDKDVHRMWTRPKDIFFSQMWDGKKFIQKYQPIDGVKDIFTKNELEELKEIIKGTIQTDDKIKYENSQIFRYFIMEC